MKPLLIFLLTFPVLCFTQEPIFKDELPKDLDTEKIIFLKHEEIKIKPLESGAASRYLHLRQSNHNKVIEESNEKLNVAALQYPFKYAISSLSSYEPLLKAGYKYVLQSRVYNYEHLQDQPKEDELIVFEYFIFDTHKNIAYKVFEMDEMKVYDSKLMIKRLNKALKKQYPKEN